MYKMLFKNMHSVWHKLGIDDQGLIITFARQTHIKFVAQPNIRSHQTYLFVYSRYSIRKMSHLSAQVISIIEWILTAEKKCLKNIVTKSILWRFFDSGTVDPIDVHLTHKVEAPKARAKNMISFKCSTNFDMTH